MKSGKTLVELAQEIMRQSECKKDLLVNTHNMEFSVDSSGQHMNVIDRKRDELLYQLRVNDIAHRQLGNYLGINAKYYDHMRANYPELLAININSWLQKNEPQQRMLRTLDGTFRAFLSEKYRPLDNDLIAETVLPILGTLGQDVRIESCEITDRRLYLKAVNPRLEAEIVPGDVVQSGVIISNSEVGQGSVNVQPLVYRLVCSNGLIVNDFSYKKYHSGRVNEYDENYEVFNSDTREAETQFILKQIRDIVTAAAEQVHFDKVVERFREAKETPITSKNIPEVVDVTGRTFKITEEERKSVLTHLIEGGDLSLYGMVNAVTKTSQDVESYDRATELEEMGHKILTMPKRQWRSINTLAA